MSVVGLPDLSTRSNLMDDGDAGLVTGPRSRRRQSSRDQPQLACCAVFATCAVLCVAQRSERTLKDHSPAARRSPDKKSSRCSSVRRWFAFGITEEVMDRNRAMMSCASSSRSI